MGITATNPQLVFEVIQLTFIFFVVYTSSFILQIAYHLALSTVTDWDVEPQDRKWHMNKANYYFPKIDRYPDLKTATLVFVASSLGLIILISALIILLYRMGARARQQRELQSRLQTISELLGTLWDVNEITPRLEDSIEINQKRRIKNII